MLHVTPSFGQHDRRIERYSKQTFTLLARLDSSLCGIASNDDAFTVLNTAVLPIKYAVSRCRPIAFVQCDALAEPASIYRCSPLSKHPGMEAADLNFGSEAGGTRRRGGRCKWPSRQLALI